MILNIKVTIIRLNKTILIENFLNISKFNNYQKIHVQQKNLKKYGVIMTDKPCLTMLTQDYTIIYSPKFLKMKQK